MGSLHRPKESLVWAHGKLFLSEINFTLDDNHLKIQQVMILIVNQQLRRPP